MTAVGGMAAAAVDLARNGWALLPCWEKTYSEWRKAKAPIADCVPRGVLDATTDISMVTAWWTRYPRALIAARVPDALLVLDVDPRHDGHTSLARLEAEHGPLPATLTTWSGRGDGGRHLYFFRPPGRLRGRALGDGIDLKTSTGYVIVPPSLHPDTGRPYRWDERLPAVAPSWMVDLLVPPPAPMCSENHGSHSGPSVADAFTAAVTWTDVLAPHAWQCLDADGDRDGARWLHPTATSACSATVRHGCLFVYSGNTPFQVTEAGDPHGYTRFRAWAVLNFGGDLSAAARELRGQTAAAS